MTGKDIRNGMILKTSVAGLACCLGVFLFSPAGRADTVRLKNGNAVSGIILNDDEQGVTLEINIGTVKFRRTEIDRVDKNLSPRGVSDLRQQWNAARQREQAARQKTEEERRQLEEGRPKTRQVSVDKETGHVFVTALINGKIPARLLVDTGATLTVLSPKIGAQIRGAKGGAASGDKSAPQRNVELTLADGRKVQSDYILLNSLSIDDSSASNVDAAIISDANAFSENDGVLGMSFMSRFNVGINQKEGKLTLEKLKP